MKILLIYFYFLFFSKDFINCDFYANTNLWIPCYLKKLVQDKILLYSINKTQWW